MVDHVILKEQFVTILYKNPENCKKFEKNYKI